MQKKKGISLIVLVITIIVMIILAATIIISLNNSNVIEKANKAVSSTDDATVKEMANMAWGEAYAKGERTVEDPDGAGDKIGLKQSVINNLTANGVDLENDYALIVTEKGVNILNRKTNWIYDHETQTVAKANTVLEVGDYISYETPSSTNYKGKWQVLGANEKGELLIVSSDAVDTIELAGEKAYVECVKMLNDKCISYKSVNIATSARSLTAEDIDKLTGYKKENYDDGNITQYGNKVTYYWDSDDRPYCIITNGKEGNISEHSVGFRYYDGKKFVTNIKPDGATDDKRVKITTLTMTLYTYLISDTGISEKILNMIVSKGDIYWLASPYIRQKGTQVSFGTNAIYNKCVGFFNLVFSDTTLSSPRVGGIRCVVTLKPDIALAGNSSDGWTVL